jgi:acetyltransferase-like isoleucine patch superfamily enzyme
VTEPFPIGVDAVVPQRPRAVARLRSRLRIARLRFRARGRMRVGAGVHFAAGVRIAAAPGASITIGDGCVLGDGARIEALGGDVRVGARTVLGPNAVVRARARVTVGEDCLVGACACLDDAAPGVADVERPIRKQPLVLAPIAIGDRARIGVHAAVLPGVTVGAGAAGGSYAVVAADVPAHGTSSGAGVA